MSNDQRIPVRRSQGVTQAEKYLKGLCDQTFLSLWSYSGIYRDQGQQGKGHGKEICDLLVVFDEHVVIFSDKDCKFPDTGDLELDWKRWYRRAVEKSAKQVWGAERWIETHPDRIYLDRSCTQGFPITLPNPDNAKYHRIVVAHDASERCKKELGGSGSLMIVPSIIGRDHYARFDDGGAPFSIGQIDPSKGYVHVLDDTSLDILLNTLDTITDFVRYLTKKEQFIQREQLIAAAGEDDLLAYYLKYLNKDGEHDFVIPPDVPSDLKGMVIDEGFWEDFEQRPERLAQIEANKVSYAWDALIETFNKHILNNTQYRASHPDIDSSEKIMRFLAREPRTRRRFLAKSLLEIIEKTLPSQRATRIIVPSEDGDPFYVFLLLPHLDGIPPKEYREVRGAFLEACCMVTKLKFPHAMDIVGIATETGLNAIRSEDAIYLDARIWGPEQQAEAQGLQNDLGILTETELFHESINEYPELMSHKQRKSGLGRTTKFPRNKPCPCGSGKKYKKCCGYRGR